MNATEYKIAVRKIQQKFNERIRDYNSQYSTEEQQRFSDKRMCAEIVILWGQDTYIDMIAAAKDVTPLVMAEYILSKVEEFKVFYANEEIRKDAEIGQLILTQSE